MEDALLLGLLNHALHAWDDRFSPALCANILFRGKGDAFVRIRQTPQFGSLYLFSADVRAYGDSIDGELLCAALGRLSWLDPEFLSFAQRLIRDRRYMCGGRVYEDGAAVKTGIPLCGFFENVYLHELDLLLESRSAFYVRYADDLLFGTQRPEERDALALEVRRFMAERKLTLHENSSIF